MINWQNFHFIRPELLWLCLPAIIIVYLLYRINASQSGWQSLVPSHLYQHVLTQDGSQAKRPAFWLLGLSWLLAVLSIAGPTWERLPQPVYQVNTGKVIVLDMSTSMRATDVAPNRLARAKFKSIDLINAIEDGEIGLVAYAGDAFVVSPLSADKNNLTSLIPALKPEIMPIPGSYPLAALIQATELLQNAGYKKGDIYWITDGIDTDDVAELREYIAQLPFQLSVLAIGTESGAPITMEDGSLFKDRGGNIVVPRLNYNLFEQVIARSDAALTSMTNDQSDIDQMLIQSALVNDDKVETDSQNTGDQWHDMGAALALILLPFAAYAFRRGLLTLVLVSLLILPPRHSWADTTASSGIKNIEAWFKNNNQKGLEAYQQSAFDQAAEHFDDPLWKGAAQYENKDYEAALKTFSQLPGTEARYNTGNTLAQLGQLEAALEAYEDVLAREPEHQKAQQNKALIESLLEQQAQEQQDDSDGEQADNSQEQTNEDQQSSDNRSSKQQNSDRQSSQQLSDEQAESEQNPNSEQTADDSQQDAQAREQEQEPENAESRENEAQNQSQEEAESKAAIQQKALEDMTPEEREQMQKMQTLLNKVPDDPAYLLQRKMLLESQRRQRERMSNRQQKEY